MVRTRWWHFFFQPAPVGFAAIIIVDGIVKYQKADDLHLYNYEFKLAQIWPTFDKAVECVSKKFGRESEIQRRLVIRVGPQVCAEWRVKDVERVVWSDLKDHPSNLGLGHNSRK